MPCQIIVSTCQSDMKLVHATILCHDSVTLIFFGKEGSQVWHMTSQKTGAKTLNLHAVTAILQAAHSNSALFTLAVSVTRPTEQDSGHIISTESGSGVSWFQGRITADMVAQVSATRRMSDELHNWFGLILSMYIVQY